MNRNAHPAVSFLYFAAAIGFSMFLLNPICLSVGFAAGFSYSVRLGGRKALKFNLAAVVPIMIAAAVINPLFNHAGVTILGYFTNGNPLTLESVLYGAAAAVSIANVILFFSCFNKVMTSDKLMCIFGGLAPSLSLIFSMSLRLVPRFKEQVKEIAAAQKGLSGQQKGKVKTGINIMSALLQTAAENAAETAESMKARGFGTEKRTAFSNFVFTKKDAVQAMLIFFSAAYVIFGALSKELSFVYFPSIVGRELSAFGISVYAAYTFLLFLPLIILIGEECKWKKLKSNI